MEDNQVRPLVRTLARELSPSELENVSGGGCSATGGITASNHNWDASADDKIVW